MRQKIYSKVFTSASSTGLVVPNTKTFTVFKIDCFSEARLIHLVILQSAGNAVAFKAELVTSKIPFGAPASYTTSFTPPANADLYRVIDQLSISSGNVGKFRDSYGVGFNNLDGTATLNQRSLYLVIAPTSGTSDCTYDVLLSFINEI